MGDNRFNSFYWGILIGNMVIGFVGHLVSLIITTILIGTIYAVAIKNKESEK